jgi:adenylate cyclase
VGYSRLIGADEPGTLAKLAALRSTVIDPQMAAHGGRVFKTTGDGLLAEFASGVQAAQCAIAIQQAMRAQEGIELRIGVHSADVTVQPDGDLLGDGVNVAARLEGLAEPGGICVSGRVREDAAGKIALDVEDIGTPELKNIAQPVRVFRVRLGAPERPALALPEKPSLVVLPFQNMSGDPEQEYFVDGLVEDITTALSRMRSLFVIARNSAFTYKGRAVDVRQVGRELGVRHVLEGSVCKAGSRLRITGQLVDAASGAHLWANRFDGALEDVFDLQDQITSNVAGAIEPHLQRAEIERAQRKPTQDLGAYDYFLRGVAILQEWNAERMPEARALFAKAYPGIWRRLWSSGTNLYFSEECRETAWGRDGGGRAAGAPGRGNRPGRCDGTVGSSDCVSSCRPPARSWRAAERACPCTQSERSRGMDRRGVDQALARRS